MPLGVDPIAENFSQVVIFGANGWMGRSSISIASRLFPKEKMLLIGSRGAHISIDGQDYEIFTMEDSQTKILENSIFLNFAYLRREKINIEGQDAYFEKNSKLTDFALKQVTNRRVRVLINASSGAAQLVEKGLSQDLYGKMKLDSEKVLKSAGDKNDVCVINNRIFSLSGRFINEFENLAISKFISTALDGRVIEITSPLSTRSYVDAEELTNLLFAVGAECKSLDFDSAGEETTIENLAILCGSLLNTEVRISKEVTAPSHYVGDTTIFDNLISKYKLKPSSLQSQILYTATALKSKKTTREG